MKRTIFSACLAVVVASFLVTGFVSIQTKAAQPGTSQSDHPDRFVRGRALVKFRSGILPEHARQIIAALGARDADEIPTIGVHILTLPYQAGEASFVQALEARAEVEFAELDQILSVQQLIPNDPLYFSDWSWSLSRVGAPDAWSTTTGNPNVIIAILDTGVDGTHEDLISQMTPGWNIYDNNSDTHDVHGHGTAVAGIAAASSNNGVGIASVCWNCRIMPVRISDDYGLATYSDIASGLVWAADHGARVANISYNATDSSTVSRSASYFQKKGGVVTVASGNSGTYDNTQDNPCVLTVGATDSTDTLYSWSNTGSNLDLVAPGFVYSTMVGGGYTVGQGTSMAAPLVAGAAALIFSVNPNTTPSQVQDILKQSADDLGTTGWDPVYGYGRLNIAQAVNMALALASPSDLIPPNDTITSPTQGQIVSSSVSVLVNVTDNVGVVRVDLYVDGVLYGSSASSPFTIKWSTRKAASGAHTLQSRAYDAAGNVGASSTLTVYK
jgi:thermitase